LAQKKVQARIQRDPRSKGSHARRDLNQLIHVVASEAPGSFCDNVASGVPARKRGASENPKPPSLPSLRPPNGQRISSQTN
jgi:hypothetical protein